MLLTDLSLSGWAGLCAASDSIPEGSDLEPFCGGSAVMYMASMDVVKSFDSIRHDKLMQVVDTLLADDEYRLRKCAVAQMLPCLLYTSPSPRDGLLSRMPSSA